MSIQNNFPAIRPSLNLDFANTKELDPRITFTRASTASYYGTQTAKAEENLLLYSQEFDNASWAKTNTTDTADSTIAPDGTTTAETLTDTTASDFHRVRQILTLVLNTDYACSAFFKKGTHSFVQLLLTAGSNNNNWATAIFDLTAGTVSQSSGSTSGTLVSSSITDVGNDWYRCSIVARTSGVAPNQMVIGFAPAASGNTFGLTGLITYAGTETDFYAWGAQLEQRSAVTAYTPTTTQPITNYIPVLETAASGVARFDHNPTTFESLGFLVEEQRTNLFTYSEQFDDAGWSKSNASITADAAVSPHGTLDADALIEDTANASHNINKGNVTTSTTTASALSFYAKAAGRSVIQVRYGVQALTNRGQGNVDLSDGTVALVQNIGTATGTTLTATAVGNGWYRVAITTNPNDAGATQMRLQLILGKLAVGSFTGASYTGDGYSGVYIWGAQLEAGAFPTSYIPTVASQVTRAADAASMTGVNFSSWYRADEGTVYAEFLRDGSGIVSGGGASTPRVWNVDDGTNSIQLRFSSSITIESTATDIFMSRFWSAGLVNKAALAYKTNDFALCVASSLTTDVTGSAGTSMTNIKLGSNTAGTGGFLNGTIRKLSYYGRRLSNEELQGLTG